jgi:hypothetical protein
MSTNLRHWSVLGRTDPKHTKRFKRSGGFEGTAIQPIWATQRMTEHFGPCGEGWGMGKPDFTVVPAGDEILVYCTVSLWYLEPGSTGDVPAEHRRVVYGVGGDKAVGRNKNGTFTDDEAFKKAYTDALSNAMKQIGVGADVHMGLFDDNKYVRAMEREFAEQETKPAEKPAAPPPQSEIAVDAEAEAKAIKALFDKCQNVDQLNLWADDTTMRRKKLPVKWQDKFTHLYQDKLDNFMGKGKAA